ncbi:transposase [Nonomuraea sp. NPDC049709]|uniref:transposase n=1 Tax=Nonomuraea sp. NPDC049709 TaxID=3154736 RepID=UPI00341B4A93
MWIGRNCTFSPPRGEPGRWRPGSCSPEFKEEAILMVPEDDRTVASAAREFDVNASALGSWVNRHRTGSYGCGPRPRSEPARSCGATIHGSPTRSTEVERRSLTLLHQLQHCGSPQGGDGSR